MKAKSENISVKQLWFAIMGFAIGSSLILPPGGAVQQNAWAAILLGFLEGLVIIYLFTALPIKFGNISFHDMLCKVFGKIIGKALFLLFIIYCFHLGSLVLRNFMDFLSITMMPEAPLISFGLAFLTVLIYANYLGIGVVTRNSELLVILTVIAVLITIVLLVKDIDLANFKPILNIPLKELAIASHGAATFPFAETVVFLLVFPFVKDCKNIRSTTMKATACAMLVILAVVVRNIAVLGNLQSISTYPSATTARLINIADIITRLEVIIFLNLTSMGFIKISVLLWGSVHGFAQLFNYQKPNRLIIPIAIAMLLVANYQFESIMENVKLAVDWYPLYAPVFQVGLPLLTLIVGKIRRLI